MFVCVLGTLPMNEPVLQIRLKKQLSGGRAPHLLQERTVENKSREILYVNTPTHSSYILLAGTGSRWEGQSHTCFSHPIFKHLTFYPLPPLLGMRNVRRRGRQETVNTDSLPQLQLPTKPKPSQLAAVTHTHSSEHEMKRSLVSRLTLMILNYKVFDLFCA